MSRTIELIQQSGFSRKHHLVVDGAFEAELDLSSFRCKGSFHHNGVTYELLKRKKLYTLEGNGQTIVQARKTFWTDRFSFDLVDRHFTVNKQGVFRSTIFLIENDSPLGTLTRTGIFKRHVHLELAEQWPVPILAFIFWMAHIIWRNEDAAAAG